MTPQWPIQCVPGAGRAEAREALSCHSRPQAQEGLKDWLCSHHLEILNRSLTKAPTIFLLHWDLQIRQPALLAAGEPLCT